MLSGSEDLEGEFPGHGADAERAEPANLRGHGGADMGPWRDRGGGRGVGVGALDHCRRVEGASRRAAECGPVAHPSSGGWAQESGAEGFSLDGGLGVVGPDRHAGGPGIAASVDLQEPACVGRPASADGACDQRPFGGASSAEGPVQLAGQPKNERRQAASRPRRPVRVHQSASDSAATGRATGHFRRHEEEGADWRFQEWGTRMASQGPSTASASSRLHHPREGKGGPLRGLRSGSKRRVGQRGDRPRHGGVCGGEHPAVVENDGASGLSEGPIAVDHGRLGRKQQFPDAPVEVGTSTAGRRDGAVDFGVPLSSGYEQVEQDRAPIVLLHQSQLEGPSSGELGGDRQSDRIHPDPRWAEGSLRDRSGTLPGGDQDHRPADGEPHDGTRPFPWRLELHLPSPEAPRVNRRAPDIEQLFIRAS